jgi:hypothetical protein
MAWHQTEFAERGHAIDLAMAISVYDNQAATF